MALFGSGIGWGGTFESHHTHFRRERLERQVLEQIGSIPGGRDELRGAALEELAADDPMKVEQAIAFLLVVGRHEDCAAVEPLVHSADEGVRRAAKACRFELRRRRRDS